MLHGARVAVIVLVGVSVPDGVEAAVLVPVGVPMAEAEEEGVCELVEEMEGVIEMLRVALGVPTKYVHDRLYWLLGAEAAAKGATPMVQYRPKAGEMTTVEEVPHASSELCEQPKVKPAPVQVPTVRTVSNRVALPQVVMVSVPPSMLVLEPHASSLKKSVGIPLPEPSPDAQAYAPALAPLKVARRDPPLTVLEAKAIGRRACAYVRPLQAAPWIMGESEGVPVWLNVWEGVPVCVLEGVPVREGEGVPVLVELCVPVCVGDTVAVPVSEDVAVLVELRVSVWEGEGVHDKDVDADGVTLGAMLSAIDTDVDADADIDAVGEDVVVESGEGAYEGVLLGVMDPLGVSVGVVVLRSMAACPPPGATSTWKKPATPVLAGSAMGAGSRERSSSPAASRRAGGTGMPSSDSTAGELVESSEPTSWMAPRGVAKSTLGKGAPRGVKRETLRTSSVMWRGTPSWMELHKGGGEGEIGREVGGSAGKAVRAPLCAHPRTPPIAPHLSETWRRSSRRMRGTLEDTKPLATSVRPSTVMSCCRSDITVA